jgi:hypothetical protein
VKSKAIIQPSATKKILADDSNEEETGSQRTRQSTRNERSNGSYKRGAYRGNRNIRTVCKETLQSLVTTFTNMELEIKVIEVHQNGRSNSRLFRKRV